MSKSNESEERALDLIRTKRVSTEGLAALLGVSWRTAARVVAALRRRGYPVVAVRNGKSGWYQLENHGTHSSHPDPLLKLEGMVRTGLRDGSTNHDHYLYGSPKKREKGS